MPLLLQYLQMDADIYIRGDSIGLLEQVIVDKYYNLKKINDKDGLRELKQDVMKLEGVISKEITQMF